jgi:hypothetical protein
MYLIIPCGTSCTALITFWFQKLLPTSSKFSGTPSLMVNAKVKVVQF